MNCQIHDSIEKSFVRGKVTTVVNDPVCQSASSFRHAAVKQKLLLADDKPPPILLQFTGGGIDQLNTLESVKCSNIRERPFDTWDFSYGPIIFFS